MITTKKILTLLSFFFVMSIDASVYLGEVINNTSEILHLDYQVPTSATILSSISIKTGGAVSALPVQQVPYTRITLAPRTRIKLSGAYIPDIQHNAKAGISITISSEAVRVFPFLLIRQNGRAIDTIHPNNRPETIQLLQQNVTSDESYVLEVQQVSGEIFAPASPIRVIQSSVKIDLRKIS